MGNDNNNRRPSPSELDGIDLSWDDDASGEIPLGPPSDENLRRTAPVPRPSEYVRDHMEKAEREEQTRSRDEKSGPRPREDDFSDLNLDLDLPPIVTPDAPVTDQRFELNVDDPGDNRLRRSYDDLSLELGTGDAPDPMELGMGEQSFELELETPILPAEEDPAITGMRDRYAAGDFTGALVLAESLLETDPEHEEANRYADSCREVLTQMYAARLGSLDQAVSVAIPADQIRWLSLDHRSGFLLSLVDGSSTIDEILDISGMTRLDALRIMYTLLEQGIIAFESG